MERTPRSTLFPYAPIFRSVTVLAELTAKFRAVWPLLDERARRLMAASEAKTLGYGGVSLVCRACGLSRRAIADGIREIRKSIRLTSSHDQSSYAVLWLPLH